MKKLVFASLLLPFLVVGCNSSDGGKGSEYLKPGNPVPPEEFKANGIFVGVNNNSAMIVAPDFGPLSSVVMKPEGSLIVTGSAKTYDNKMEATGVMYYGSGGSGYEAESRSEIVFDANYTIFKSSYNGSSIEESFKKIEDSLDLASLEGTHTSPLNGDTIKIEADGSLTINGSCTVTGTLKRTGFYYGIDDAEAVACSDSTLNGAYQGALATVNFNGEYMIASIFVSPEYAVVSAIAEKN
ncbi:hypothetical protein C942_04944 [Photobacterium marinum]|uniref:Lipoprotein n=1 Tax=Photobacterium marinum TaxID=1056511 RepID=L8JFU5_9GAMM|nr:hypothetical protein [Photobacterium marinum]ELR66282.1 hypothetical protein C942_04944 [Photobacterium marinum]